MAEPVPHIAVCIPSFRRPQALRRLLMGLAQLETMASVEVLVADNDPAQHQAYDLCCDLSASYRWPLQCEIIAEPGVVAVRNALVTRALAGKCDFVAMIDDDEWPDAAWLDGFLAMQAKTGAEVLGGSILFDKKTAAGWAECFDGVATITRPDGPIDMLAGAGNIFLTRHVLESLTPPWFDPAFGLTGGEDREFFERLRHRGCRFAWSGRALAYTEVPDQRITLRWALTRAFRIGNTEMRILLKYHPGAGMMARNIVKMVLALLFMLPLSVILLPFPNRAADALRRWFRNIGKLAALFGHHHKEYAEPHAA